MAPRLKTPGPDFDIERATLTETCSIIAGVDEAGRGPLAGPVVAAAVVLDPNNIPSGLDDSKAMSERAREAVYDNILASADVAFCCASPARIDRMNIRGATLWAMCGAVKALPRRPHRVFIDGRDFPDGMPCPGEAVIGGDARMVSIAAASIVAKVTRDRLMKRLALSVPDYGFERHMGYPTAAHRLALQSLGPSPHHRRSFGPVRIALERQSTK